MVKILGTFWRRLCMLDTCSYICFYVYVQSLSHIRLLSTPWTVARQAPLSMKFSRQEYWNGLPFPSPGDVPDPGIEPVSPGLAGRFFTIEPSGKPGHRVSSYYYYGSSYICSSSHARAAHKSRRQESRTGSTRYAGWLDGGPVAVGS